MRLTLFFFGSLTEVLFGVAKCEPGPRCAGEEILRAIDAED